RAATYSPERSVAGVRTSCYRMFVSYRLLVPDQDYTADPPQFAVAIQVTRQFFEANRWTMSKARLEAFSDGVFAILITILVLELKIPHGDDLRALAPLLPVFLTYVLSFVYLGIYWNNHHHMLHATTRINCKVLCATLHLLFWF